MGSSRLPGKVLADIGGASALDRLIHRLGGCRRLDDIVLATSTAAGDDVLERWGRAAGLAVHRGSENNVLQRVVDAQRLMRSDLVVEVTGDCPLLDPEIIDLGIETFLANDCDVVTNVRVASYPQGADVQVVRTDDLADVATTINDPAVQEHVSLHFYETPARYRVIHLIAPHSSQAPDLRLQLDYPEDLEFIRTIYARLEPIYGSRFSVPQILELLGKEPSLGKINAHCSETPVR